MNKTEVYEDFTTFNERENKEANGVSPEFAEANPDYEEQNKTNIGCWDCEWCYHCENCTDCRYCTRCTGCINCKYCLDCEDCEDCRDCEDCQWCDRCRDCYGDQHLEDFDKLEDE